MALSALPAWQLQAMAGCWMSSTAPRTAPTGPVPTEPEAALGREVKAGMSGTQLRVRMGPTHPVSATGRSVPHSHRYSSAFQTPAPQPRTARACSCTARRSSSSTLFRQLWQIHSGISPRRFCTSVGTKSGGSLSPGETSPLWDGPPQSLRSR